MYSKMMTASLSRPQQLKFPPKENTVMRVGLKDEGLREK